MLNENVLSYKLKINIYNFFDDEIEIIKHFNIEKWISKWYKKDNFYFYFELFKEPKLLITIHFGLLKSVIFICGKYYEILNINEISNDDRNMFLEINLRDEINYYKSIVQLLETKLNNNIKQTHFK